MPVVERRRFVVSGVVQGVGFRWATRVEAARLGLVGYARNLVDGTVEIEAEGGAQELAELASWLDAGGPPSARVTSVDAAVVPPRGGSAFDAR
ncbi:acylphosphatase [Frondihabitans australicus]|uniref:Acylphosphatase n=1 Tax=Frondihabitans australicus TaxID=386892 RepID=A0A495ICI7_9MICO|nr:acylphosphatase [Frondihabitans australicus]RKR73011.1 acylphosphatase [Frondihabitans australicus]